MVFLSLFSLVVLATVVNGQTPISCPGVNLVRVGCFNSVKPQIHMPNLHFTKKVNYRFFDDHMRSMICGCTKACKGKACSFGIRNAYECRTGSLYAREQNTKNINQCRSWKAQACKSGVDCVGSTNTMFVYRVMPKTTPKPTTKKPTTIKTTKKSSVKPTTPSKTTPENLQCYTYSVTMKLIKAPLGGQGSPAYNHMQCHICKTIRLIYQCYPCYQSVHFLKVTTSSKGTFANIILKFGCKAAHLKPLVNKLQKGAIVSATCHDGKCPQTPLLAQTVPGCTMTTACPVTPACMVPACAAPPPPPPAPLVYTCPVGCPVTCAPTCAPACCKSAVKHKKKKQSQLFYSDYQRLYG